MFPVVAVYHIAVRGIKEASLTSFVFLTRHWRQEIRSLARGFLQQRDWKLSLPPHSFLLLCIMHENPIPGSAKSRGPSDRHVLTCVCSLMYLWELRLEEPITQRPHSTWWRLPELQGPLELVVTCSLGYLLFPFLIYFFVCILYAQEILFLLVIGLLVPHAFSRRKGMYSRTIYMPCLPPPPRYNQSISLVQDAAAGTSHTFAQSGHCPSQRGHCYGVCDWCPRGWAVHVAERTTMQ